MKLGKQTEKLYFPQMQFTDEFIKEFYTNLTFASKFVRVTKIVSKSSYDIKMDKIRTSFNEFLQSV